MIVFGASGQVSSGRGRLIVCRRSRTWYSSSRHSSWACVSMSVRSVEISSCSFETSSSVPFSVRVVSGAAGDGASCARSIAANALAISCRKSSWTRSFCTRISRSESK